MITALAKAVSPPASGTGPDLTRPVTSLLAGNPKRFKFA
jgi:hypothetical protein